MGTHKIITLNSVQIIAYMFRIKISHVKTFKKGGKPT